MKGLVVRGVWRGWPWGAALLAALAVPVWAGTFELRADILSTEATTQTVVARGRVRITDGVSVARAGHARYAIRDGRVVLSDGVVVQTPDGIMRSREATILLSKGQRITSVAASGGVRIEAGGRVMKADRVFYDAASGDVIARGTVTIVAPPDFVASGDDLTANLRSELARLRGRARVQNSEGFIEGDRLDVDGQAQTASVRDHVVAGFRKLRLTADTATLTVREHKAVFRGHVEIVDAARTVTADQVTMYYQIGRVIVEGTASVRIEEERP